MRRILHIDMDAFYASVEQRDNPALARQAASPSAASPNRRGVVAAASYEARAFGVRSAMSMAKAVRLCPSLVIVPPDFSRYTGGFEHHLRYLPGGDAARRAAVAGRGVSRCHREQLERTARDDGREAAEGSASGTTTGLTASAGVAPNKFLAKIASGWKKPDGLTVIAPDRVEPFLQQLPVDALWGVGPVTARKLARARHHEADRRPRHRSNVCCARRSAAWPTGCAQLAHGIDEQAGRRRTATRKSSRIGKHVSAGPRPTQATIRAEVERDGARRGDRGCERKDLFARTVTIKVRYADFTTVTRSHTTAATREVAELARRAVQLLERTDAGQRPVRLLGVSVHNLCTALTEPEVCADWLPFS